MADPGLIAIFGCAVLADGRASPSLRRRIACGRRAAALHPDAPILCSGGLGRHPPSEAAVMASELAASGVPRERLILDETSADTLQSAVIVASEARRREATVIVCSDRYHVPRIRMMLRLLGARSRPGPLAPGRGGAPATYWTWMMMREGLAIPYDLAVVLRRRRHLIAAAS